MAISKIVYKESPEATPVTWMDATPATAGAADIMAPKTAMLADGVLTTGTGSGGGTVEAEEKDVNFIDYDGTILYSYTAAEFAQLAALPANPTHTGLTAQGWNWSLSDAKTYVASYGKLWIGQMYITFSGDTEIDCSFNDAGLLTPFLKIAVNGTVTVDWGDGTIADTVTGTSLYTPTYTAHTYAAIGNRTIKIHVVSGSFTFYGSYILANRNNPDETASRYNSSIRAIRLGNGITELGDYAFQNCYSLKTVTIPDSVTSLGVSNNFLFEMCYSIQAVIIPNRLSFVVPYLFYGCRALQKVALPNNMTSIGQSAFRYCHLLQSIALPDSITTIENITFQNCYSLKTLTIPGSVTSIGSNSLANCYSIYKLVFKPTTPPTVANSNAFGSLPTDCIIYVPYSADHSVLAAYQSATNYPSSSTYTYMEE